MSWCGKCEVLCKWSCAFFVLCSRLDSVGRCIPCVQTSYCVRRSILCHRRLPFLFFVLVATLESTLMSASTSSQFRCLTIPYILYHEGINSHHILDALFVLPGTAYVDQAFHSNLIFSASSFGYSGFSRGLSQAPFQQSPKGFLGWLCQAPHWCRKSIIFEQDPEPRDVGVDQD